MTWRNWSSISEGSCTPGAPITAIPYGGLIAVFLADPGGGVFYATGHPDTGWSGWAPIPGQTTTPGARVSAILTAGRIALFITDSHGEVFSVFGSPDTGWEEWRTAAQGGSVPGAPICVAPYENRVAIFLANPGGEVFNTGGYPANPSFGGYWTTVSQGSTTPGAPLSVLPYAAGFAIFLADPGGGVYYDDGDPDHNWRQWRSAAQGSTMPGAPVCAVLYGNRIALFMANRNGEVVNTAGYPGNDTWGGSWASVSQGSTTPGAPVTAVPYGGGFAVFLADPNGGVYFATGNPDANYGAWTPVLLDFRTKPGAHISVVPINGDRLALFATDQKGEVFTTCMKPKLQKAEIRFDTLDDGKEKGGFVSVFLKTRLNNSLTPNSDSDFLSNYFALLRYQAAGDHDYEGKNPYIAFGLSLGGGTVFTSQAPNTFTLALFSPNLTVDDVVLPQVDIHFLADGTDRWMFNYTVTLTFDNGTLSFSSTADGVPGIILDQGNRSHTGMGSENTLRTLPIPELAKPVTNAVLTRVTLDFWTHSSADGEHDDKNADTILNVHIVNRVSAQSVPDILIGTNLLPNIRFPDSVGDGETSEVLHKQIVWANPHAANEFQLPVSIRLADMVLPMTYIVISAGTDRWIFDYQVTFDFVDPADFNQKPQSYSSRTNGITLDQSRNKHAGIYQGRAFPTVAPPTAPVLTAAPAQRRKVISIPLLRRKLTELIVSRNGAPGSPPSLFGLHLGAVLLPGVNPDSPTPVPESYADMQALVNGGDGTPHYVSSPHSLGQEQALWGVVRAYIRGLNVGQIFINFDATRPTPVTVIVNVDPGVIWDNVSGVTEIPGGSVTLSLSIAAGTTQAQFTVVDLLSWVPECQDLVNKRTLDHVDNNVLYYHYKGTFLGQPVDAVGLGDYVNSQLVSQVIQVGLTYDGVLSGTFKGYLRDAVYGHLGSLRDGMNSALTTWLVGGVVDDAVNTDGNNVVIHSASAQVAGPQLVEDSIVIDYSGPGKVFEWQQPANWPAGVDFSPSSLANIKHIIVLTKENRSFDHMLGYLSLPVGQGGMGRQDIDGLKGGERNPYQGQTFPSFPLTQTRFAPGPPNQYEAVHHAINYGNMDGFVASHAALNGDAMAGQVMGYHTAATVPVFDALARDFAIGHRWFASHPGPTFPNRFYELTGRPNLDPHGFWELENSSPIRPAVIPTIFESLQNATDPVLGGPVTWRYYEFGYCTLRYFDQYTFDNANIVNFDDPLNGFFACCHTGNLPSVTFIDPHFVDYAPGSNCDEPPSDVADGQALVQTIVEAVIASPAWSSTLLLIVYDEHGGFFDHVAPPLAPKVSPDIPVTTLGLRVPAMAISPFVTPGSVFGTGTYFDHTSILKTIARRFLSNAPPYLGPRYAAANDLSSILNAQARMFRFRPFIRYRFQHLGSGWMLDVQEANPAPGTVLWQFSPNGTNAQDFSFEYQDDGFAYLRSYVSHLYLTVQTAGGTSNILSPRIIQDVKYPPASGTGPQPSARQRWTVTEVLRDGNGGTIVEISSEAYPDLRLRPVDPAQFQSQITLVAAMPESGEYRWRALSPVLA